MKNKYNKLIPQKILNTTWIDTYPHIIMASAILVDEKIARCNIGQYTLKKQYSINNPDLCQYVEKQFIANNIQEHIQIINEEFTKWLKQWRFHEDFKGIKPY